MKTTINLTYSPRHEIPYLNEHDARMVLDKGWTLSSTYFFSEIRDVYLALRESGQRDLEGLYDYCVAIRLPYERTEWQKRRLLEHVNALINFGLLHRDYRIARDVFTDAKIGAALSESDLEVFRDIYFSYFRFRELLSWFIDLNPENRLNLLRGLDRSVLQKKAKPLFAFSESGRFVNSFFRELRDNAEIYYIRQSTDSDGLPRTIGNEDLMRFWDVFVAWGLGLNVIEKFSLEDLGITSSSGKNIFCCFLISSSEPKRFNLKDYISEHYAGGQIFLPELVFEIASKYRLSIKKTHELIVTGYKENRERFSLERTSEVFVRRRKTTEKDRVLYPKYNDSYISHLTLRK
jgi:hypothetical protein